MNELIRRLRQSIASDEIASTLFEHQLTKFGNEPTLFQIRFAYAAARYHDTATRRASDFLQIKNEVFA